MPSVTRISFRRDPYLVLVSSILSLRTKDKVTIEASQKLFSLADNPYAMVELSPGQIKRVIYPVGFYRNKAKVILGVSRRIISEFKGKVPRTLSGLLALKGVGRKTANLVLGMGYHIPAICVDTHVHRISNRLGWVHTRTPEETEEALKKIIPPVKWIELNTIMVSFGQNICLPVSPFCSRCTVNNLCKKSGVRRFR
ncbi:MAG: endonuclease III [Candidatus Omnitrophica bacterium]|nr:endonuclease III [Candidatus Omnitrophota bacterium]